MGRMALFNRRRRGSWIAFGVRALGVLGIAAFLLGWLGASATPGYSFRGTFPQLEPMCSLFDSKPPSIGPIDTFPGILQESTDRILQISVWLLTIGCGLVVLSLLFVLLGGLGRLAGRHSIVGTNGLVQSALAATLLIG